MVTNELLLAQGDHRIDACRAAGREDGGGERDRPQSRHHGAEHQRIGRSYAVDLILQRAPQRERAGQPQRKTATAQRRSFSVDVPPKSSVTLTVSKAGSYPYYCTYHPDAHNPATLNIS